jgi:uncharacterized membrane protein
MSATPPSLSPELRAREDYIVARVLRSGAYGSLLLLLLGTLLGYTAAPGAGRWLTQLGLLVLILTPLIRVLIAWILFLREKDTRYAWISFGVLLILLCSSLLSFLHLLPTLER